MKLRTLAVISAAFFMLVAVLGLGPVTADASSAGILKVGLSSSDIPSDFDTAFTFGDGEQDRWVGLEMYDCLTRYDYSVPTTQSPPVVGGLAKSWTVNKNATLYTFTTRAGVKFTDGTAWNAAAAVFNLDRYTVPTDKYYTKALNAVAGFYIGGIGTVTLVNSNTFTVATKDNKPYSFLIDDLTLLPMGSPTAIKAGPTKYASHPVGTGPFEFVSFTSGHDLILKRNPDYWGGEPKLTELQDFFLPDNSARVAALQKGEVNLIESTPPDDLKELQSSGFDITSNAYNNVYRCVFDTTKAPFNNIEVRQAANLALDRQALTSSLLDGEAVPAVQAASAADLGYNASLNTTLGYNLAKAKALMTSSGVKAPVTATFSYVPTGSGQDPDPSVVMPFLQAELAKIGINVTPVAMTNTALNNDQQNGLVPGHADAGCWIGTQVLPSLWQVFVSTDSLDDGHYSDPIVDKAFTDAEAATTAAGQYHYLEILNTQEAKDGAWLYIATDVDPRAYSPTVHGFKSPKSYFLSLLNVSVS